MPRLQRKVLELEKALAANAKLYAHRSGSVGGGIVQRPGSAGGADGLGRRMLPREPALTNMPGHSATITCLVVHPNFTICASGSEDSTIKIWDHESGEYRRTLKGHTNSVRSVDFTPAGNYLASSSSDLTIKLWDMESYRCVRTLRGHDHTISAVKFVPLSMQYLNSNALEAGNGNVEGNQTATGIEATAAGTAFLISASRDKTIKFWDVETGFVSQTISHQDWIRCLAVRPTDGAVIASAGNELSINIYQTSGERNKIANLVGHEHVIECLSFITAATPKERKDRNDTSSKPSLENEPWKDYLVSAGRDRSVRVWNITTQQCVNVFRVHENWVRSVILHPSGKYVISAGDDRTIRVLDLKSNRCIRTLDNAHSHFVTSLAMHHTLPIMVSGSVDQNVNCWQLE